MPERHRVRNATLVALAAIVAAICVLSVVDLTIRQQDGAHRIEEKAAASQRQRYYAVANCTSSVLVEKLVCVLDAYAAEQEAQRSAEDLQAQQESARAAFWMVTLGGVQALVAIGGFAIIFRSLDLTRAGVAAAERANEQTRISSERQLRAYVTVEKITLRYAVGKPIHLEITLSNSGQTPAREFRHSTMMGSDDEGRIGAARMFRSTPMEVFSMAEIGAGKPYIITITGAGPLTEETMAQLRTGKPRVEFGGYASYRDVFKRRHLFVFRTYLAFRNGNPEIQASNKHNSSN